jgi:hypothetical protein
MATSTPFAPYRRQGSLATIATWAKVNAELWTASIGSNHIGRVEQIGEIFRAIDNHNRPLGAFLTSAGARFAVTSRPSLAGIVSHRAAPPANRHFYAVAVSAVCVTLVACTVAAMSLIIHL